MRAPSTYRSHKRLKGEAPTRVYWPNLIESRKQCMTSHSEIFRDVKLINCVPGYMSFLFNSTAACPNKIIKMKQMVKHFY
jgi:hypothetical protein